MPKELQTQSEFMFYTSPSDGQVKINISPGDETVWVTQKQMSEIFCVDVSGITKHLANIFDTGELDETSNVQKMHIASSTKPVNHYNLDVVISVGYRVNSHAATQFRIWATMVLKEYLVKGFAMDDERLKQGNNLFGNDYFEELLERIREIRNSERRLYQKITDIYALSSDYDKDSPISHSFFASVQNKLHWAVTGQTAAELIFTSADAEKQNMGLKTWKNAPDGKILKTDIRVAKNYLEEPHIRELNTIVSAYLDLAENRANRSIVMKMSDWVVFLDRFLELSSYSILEDKGKISAEKAKLKAESEYEIFRVEQDKNYISDFDRAIEHIREHGSLPKAEIKKLQKQYSDFDSKLKTALSYNSKE